MSTTWNRSLRGLALSLCVVMVLAPVVRVEAMTSNTGSLRATVGVGVSHAPVELITVRVVNVETAEQVAIASTDANGAVELPVLPVGTYLVSAAAPNGFVATAAPIVEVAEATMPEVAITLAPAQDGQDEMIQEEEECEDGDDECVAAAAAAAAAAGGGGIPLWVLLLGGAGAVAGIIGVANQDDSGDTEVITQ